MSEAVKKFNGLSGAVGTKEVKKIAILAEKEGQTTLARRLQAALKEAEKHKAVVFNPGPLALEEIPACYLPGIDHVPPYISAEEFSGLNKAVSPDDIYQYITDLMLKRIEKAGSLPWHKMWDDKINFKTYKNFDTKKPYRGINFFLLNLDDFGDFVQRENPYFLTFKQIEKHGGQLNKGAKGVKIVYFTKLYSYSQEEPKLSFATYNEKKFNDWMQKNKAQIPEREQKLSHYIPILKYYNVFSGEDVTGIDFGDFPKAPTEERNETEKIQAAESIVDHYPNPPKVKFTGNQPAYYPRLDEIKMTPLAQFTAPQYFYSVFFHELVHSTGHSKRLDRGNDTRIRNGGAEDQKAYDFEELVAEMGAVFLSAESGILFQTRDQSAVYLNHYIKKLKKRMKEDNRFFFRAASASQAAADYILDRDKKGVPAYQKEIAALNAPWHEGLAKQALNNCSRLNPGYKYDKDGKLQRAKVTLKTLKDVAKKSADFEAAYKAAMLLDVPAKVVKQLRDKYNKDLKLNPKQVFEAFYKDTTGKSPARNTKKEVAPAPDKKAVAAKEEKKSTHRFTKGQTVQVSKRWGKTQSGTEGTVKELRKSAHGDPMYSVMIGKDLLFFPETVLQLPKKKLSKEELEKANPEPKVVKPKSVSVQTAVSDVLRLDKFNFKEVTPLKASLIFNLFKNIDLTEGETSVDNASNYALSVLKNDGPFHSYYDSNQEIDLTSLGAEFVNAVKNRLESLRNQKHNYALFDGLNGAKTEFNKHVMQSAKKGYSAAEIFVLGYPQGELKKHLPAHLITLSGKVLKKAMAQTKDHNLNWGNIVDLPKNINNPQAIFKSKSKGFVVLTYVKDVNKKPVMVAVHLDTKNEVVKIASIYARSNFNTYKIWIKEGLALFVDKKSELFPYAQATIAVGGNNPQSHKNTKTKPNSKKSGLKSPTIEPKTTAGGQSIGGSSRPLLSGKSKTLKASDIANMDFETLPLDEGWEKLFQQAPKNMRIAVWAKPKNGKTATCAAFASYLTKFGPILYNFADQGINLSTKNLIELSGLDKKPNAYISTTDNLNTLAEEIEATGAHHVVIDMINQYINNGVTPHIFKKEILQRFPEVGFTLVMEVTKGGDFKGDQSWTHLVDQLVTIENYIADTKGRYGTGEKITWEEGAQKYDPQRYAEIKANETPAEAPPQNEVSATNENEETLNFKVY